MTPNPSSTPGSLRHPPQVLTVPGPFAATYARSDRPSLNLAGKRQ